jgi:hypothetical protein
MATIGARLPLAAGLVSPRSAQTVRGRLGPGTANWYLRLFEAAYCCTPASADNVTMLQLLACGKFSRVQLGELVV